MANKNQSHIIPLLLFLLYVDVAFSQPSIAPAGGSAAVFQLSLVPVGFGVAQCSCFSAILGFGAAQYSCFSAILGFGAAQCSCFSAVLGYIDASSPLSTQKIGYFFHYYNRVPKLGHTELLLTKSIQFLAHFGILFLISALIYPRHLTLAAPSRPGHKLNDLSRHGFSHTSMPSVVLALTSKPQSPGLSRNSFNRQSP